MNYQLELRHFRYFLAVAEELSFSKASVKLFISQPGLSKQIRLMEETLGVKLFDRNKRNVALTKAGEYLKGEIEFINSHLEATKRNLKTIAEGNDGEVRIGFLGSAMQNIIPDLLVNLDKKHPKIKTTLEELSNISQINAIEHDQLDLGFVRLARVPEGIEKHPVFKDSFSVVLPKNHHLNEDNFKNIGQLAEENFILFSSDYSPYYYNKIMGICEDKGFTPKISHKSVHALTIFKLVENGLGVAIIPTTMQEGFNLKIKFLKIKNIKQTAELSVVWKKDNRNPCLNKVLELLLKK
jgi:DNA-binding transcriptional LysR family regulator